MAGEYYFYYSLILLCLAFNNAQSKDATSTKSTVFIKGSILFEKVNENPATINPPTLMFSKFLNLTTLDKVIRLSHKFTETYRDFCDNLNSRLYNEDSRATVKYFISDEKKNLNEAEKFCKDNNGILPEIRTHQESFKLKAIMRQNKLSTTLSGIKIGKYTDTWTFISDNENIQQTHVFTGAYVGPKSTDKKLFFDNELINLSNQARNRYITYDFNQDNYLRLMLLSKDTNWLHKVVCQIDTSPQYNKLASTLLLRMTAHNCKRDLQNIAGTSKIVEKETQRFTRDTTHANKTNEISQVTLETINCREFTFNYLFDKCCDNFLTYHLFLTKESKKLSTRYFTSKENIQAFLIFRTLQKAMILSYKLNFTQFSFQNEFPNYTSNSEFTLPQKQLLFYFNTTLAQINLTTINEKFITRIPVNTSIHLYEKYIHTNKRHKRNIGLGMLAGYAGLNTAASFGTGDAPLGWVGSLLGDTFGWAKHSDLRKINELAYQQSLALDNLTINQKELEDAYNVLGHEVTRLENETKTLEFSTATLFNELDHKMAIRDLHNTIQLTLLKIANSLSFAQNGKTSPYVLSRDELNVLSAKYKINGVSLSNDLDDVRTTAYYADTNILFTFVIPIMEDAKRG